MRAIRRLSKLPPLGVSLEQLMKAYSPPVPEIPTAYREYPTPPLSRKSSVACVSLNSRARSSPKDLNFPRHRSINSVSSLASNSKTLPPDLPLPPLPMASTLPNMLSKLNKRQRAGSAPLCPALSVDSRKMSQGQISELSAKSSVASSVGSAHRRGRSSGSSIMGPQGLRTLILPERRVAPTF